MASPCDKRSLRLPSNELEWGGRNVVLLLRGIKPVVRLQKNGRSLPYFPEQNVHAVRHAFSA